MITTFYRGTDITYKNYLNGRNELLLAFFHSNSITNIRIIGNAENPLIVYQEKVRLSCYVKDMNLILLDSVDGSIISTLAINTKKVLDVESLLMDFLETSIHEKIWKIALTKSPALFLTGFNYLDKILRKDKYPVFARLEPRIYITEEKAINTLRELPDYNLKLQ